MNDYQCPRCGRGIPSNKHRGEYPGARSRHEQGVEICSDCGTDEGMRDSGLDPRGTLPREDWFDQKEGLVSEYPECTKLGAMSDSIEDFVEIAEWLAGEGLLSVGLDPEDLAHKFFGIDDKKVESERRQMLKAARKNGEV